MVTYKVAGSSGVNPVTVSLEEQAGGFVMVKMLDARGYTWNVIRFNPDGTFTRSAGVNVTGLAMDSISTLRIQESV